MNALFVLVALWVSTVLPLPLPATLPPCLSPPVHARVAVQFRAPLCPYCSGKRGIEYSTSRHDVVRAAAGGVVTFSGVVVATRYVIVAHSDQTLATYGMLADSAVQSGDLVTEGQIVGHSTSRLYFGLRRSGAYIDPVPLLAQRRWSSHLIPANGAASRPTQIRRPSCEIVAATGKVTR
jgi:hypothetical protein